MTTGSFNCVDEATATINDAFENSGTPDASDERMRALRDKYVADHLMIARGEASKMRILSAVYEIAEVRTEESTSRRASTRRRKNQPLTKEPQTDSGSTFFVTPDKAFAWHLRSLAGELGVAVRESDHALRNRCYDAYTVITHFADWLEALEKGQIELRHIRALLRGARALPNKHWAEFSETVLEYACENTPSKTSKFAEETTATLAAKTYEETLQRARDERTVHVFPSSVPGMATLYAYLPIERAIAIDQLLTKEARILRDEYQREAAEHDRTSRAATSAANANRDMSTDSPDAAAPLEASLRASASSGASAMTGDAARNDVPIFQPDERTVTQIKADIFADLLLTATPESILNSTTKGAARVKATVNITLPAMTLLTGRVDGSQPALLDGESLMSFEEARQFAANVPSLQRVFNHPVTGQTVCVDSYDLDRSLRRFLHVRDETCRFPGCSRPAASSDIDHTTPFSEGGKTSINNLSVLCRVHHVLKHQRNWGLEQLGEGTLLFKSPLGYETVTRPRRRGPEFRPTGEMLGADPRDPDRYLDPDDDLVTAAHSRNSGSEPSEDPPPF